MACCCTIPYVIRAVGGLHVEATTPDAMPGDGRTGDGFGVV